MSAQVKTECLCPHSSLTISRGDGEYARWLTARYRINFSVLGGAITYSRPEGYVDEDNLRLSLDMDRSLINAILKTRKGYVQIEDYAGLESSSFRARMLFTEFISGNRECAGVIFCNLSLSFRTAVKLAMPKKRLPCPVLIAEDYAQAVDWAQEICEREDILLDYGALPFSSLSGSKSLFPLEVTGLAGGEEDSPHGTDLPLTCLLNRGILYYILKPETDVELIDRIAREGETLMMAGAGKSIGEGKYILADCSRLKGVASPVRRYAAKKLKSVMTGERKPEILLFNLTSMGKAVIKLLSPLIPLRLTPIDRAEEALRQVLDNASPDLDGMGANRESCEGQLDHVIALLSGIEWDKRGIALTREEEDPRMKVLLEAIKLIKEELDNLLEEKELSYNRLEDTIRSLREISALGTLFTEVEVYLRRLSDSPRIREEDRNYLSQVTTRVAHARGIIERDLRAGDRELFF